MPLDPKKTKNGVNLNEIDVSKLALVDKEGLIDDLGKRLKAEIQSAISGAVKSMKPQIEGIVGDAFKSQQSSSGGTQQPPQQHNTGATTKTTPTKQPKSGGGGGGGNGNPPKPPKPPKTPKAPKAPKAPKPQMNSGGGNVYSDVGKQYAEDLDELAESYQTLNLKELEAAQKRLSDVQESIRFSMVGKEQALLSKATANLQTELANEAKKRGTTLGKIGNFLDRENINAASIISGIFSDSPMVGLMTKAVMESIRHKRAAAQKQKSDQLKIGDIKQHLPRPDDFHQQQQQPAQPSSTPQQGQQPPQTQQSAPQQPPQQATQPERVQPVRNGPADNTSDPAYYSTPPTPNRGPAQVHNIGDYANRRPERVENEGEDDEPNNEILGTAMRLHKQSKRRARGNYQREKYDQGYEQGKRTELEKLHGQLEEAKKKAEELSKGPDSEKDDGVFGSPKGNAESSVNLLEKQVASIQKILDDIEKEKEEQAAEEKRALEYMSKGERKQNNVVEMPKAPERVQEPLVEGKAALEHHAGTETHLHPETSPEGVESGDNKIVSILSGMRSAEDKENKTLDVFNSKNRDNPFHELEKLSHQQLTELEKISKIMALQLEAAHLAADAAQRETKEKALGEGGVGGLVEGAAKKKTEEKGGLGIMDAIFGGVEGLHGVQLLTQGIKGIKNFGKNLFKGKGAKGAEKVAEGVGEGAKVAEGVGEGAKVAEGAGKGAEALKTVEGAGKGAEAVKEAGFFSKLLGKVPGAKLLGKIPGASKFGKFGKGLLHNAGYITTAIDLGIGYANAKDISKRTAGLEQGQGASGADKFKYKAGTAGAYAVGQALGFIPELLGFNHTSDKITGAMLKGEAGLYKAANEGSMVDDLVKAIKSGTKEDKEKAVKKWGTNFPMAAQVIDMGAANWKNPNWPPGTPENFVDHVLHPEHMKKTPATKPGDKPGEKKPGEQPPGQDKPGEKKPGEPTAPPSTSPTPTTPPPPPATTPTPEPPPTAPPPTSPKPETPLPDDQTSSGGHPVAAHAGMMKGTTSPFSTSLSASSAAMNKGARMSPKLTGEQQGHVDELRSILKESGMNEKEINAIVGNAGKETGFSLKGENLNYGGTPNDRIRQIFGARAANKTDAELDAIKKDPKKFGEFMYGKDTKVGRGMGNTEEGDGYKFRGRGYIQLTGKNNYAAASKAIFGDDRLVKDPDLVSKSEVAAKVTAWYTKTAGANMAKQMGVDLKNGSQEDINLAYTSAIAGRKIKRGEGFLGNEVINKVDMFAQAGGPGTPSPMQGGPGTPPKTEVASAKPIMQPPAPPEAGKRLTQASMQNTDLVRTASAAPPSSTNQSVFAPSNVTQNTNILPGVKAQNTESTYQRTMDHMYVST